MTTRAIEYYTSPAGMSYWDRNSRHCAETSQSRINAIISLAPHLEKERWVEVGCGMRYNLRANDIGIDINPRVFPDIVAPAHDIPMPSASHPLVFCVGVLMHLPTPLWQEALTEMARIATHVIIIGEYAHPTEVDMLWNPSTGEFGTGEKGYVWKRPYTAPAGWIENKKTTFPKIFGPEVTFYVFTPHPLTYISTPLQESA